MTVRLAKLDSHSMGAFPVPHQGSTTGLAPLRHVSTQVKPLPLSLPLSYISSKRHQAKPTGTSYVRWMTTMSACESRTHANLEMTKDRLPRGPVRSPRDYQV